MIRKLLLLGWIGLGACQTPVEEPSARSFAATVTLFSDSFSRTVPIDSGLGADWTIVKGLWFTHGMAETDSDGGNQVSENRAGCADCRVEARVLGFGVPSIGVYLRAPSPTASSSRYEVVLTSDRQVMIRRFVNGASTILAQGSSGLPALDDWATLSLEARGAQLIASVNGVVKLQVNDTSAQAITAGGYAGMWSSSAGTQLDEFVLSASAAPVDAGTPDLAHPIDLAHPVDLATSSPDLSAGASGPLFSDAFSCSVPIDSGLGVDWTILRGAWFTRGEAETDRDGGDQATANRASCGNCRVEVRVLGFGVPEIGAYLRAPSATNTGDRYDVVLTSGGRIQIRRFRGGVAVLLGDAPNGLAALGDWATLSLETSGTAPVLLTARVNGAVKLQASDGSAQALTAAGYAGMWSTSAGVLFDDFLLSGTGSSPVDAGAGDLSVPRDLAAPPSDLASSGPNPVVRENARPGDSRWPLHDRATNHEIEGYASSTSVPRGGRISFFVRSNDASYTIQIFRIGWYGGAGARAVTNAISRNATPQPSCPMDAASGRVECNWIDPFVLDVPASADASDWASGWYLAHLTGNQSNKDAFIRFVVRDDARSSDYLMQSSVTTWQAYNIWGGKSLYDFNSTGGRAHEVSFNRPYSQGLDEYELSMVRFLERQGYDVSYATSLDTHASGAQLLRHRAFLSVGHDEYWSSQMRTNVQTARDRGVHLAFFSANVSYWQVRFQPSPVSGAADRSMVCYKDAQLDPIAATDPSQATVHFRDPQVNRPEDEMIGVMYQYDPVDGDLIVQNTSHWVFAGSGLRDGDALHRLLGYEVDGVFADKHPGLVRLGHSPYRDSAGTLRYSDMTIYSAPSGALVFATGSIWWAYGLDGFIVQDRVSPAVQQITRNLLSRFRLAP